MAILHPQSHSLKLGDAVLIRSAAPSDAAALLKYAHDVMSEPRVLFTEWDEIDQSEDAESKFIQHAIDAAGELLLIAEVESQIVGALNFATYAKRKRAHGGEFGMSVKRPWRDKGIGRLMLTALLEWAREQKTIEQIELSVFSRNGRAIHLYRALGFQEQGRLHKAIKFGDGSYDDLILMWRAV
jgi:RimJ/RimL family protein N-acetyltransferase